MKENIKVDTKELKKTIRSLKRDLKNEREKFNYFKENFNFYTKCLQEVVTSLQKLSENQEKRVGIILMPFKEGITREISRLFEEISIIKTDISLLKDIVHESQM